MARRNEKTFLQRRYVDSQERNGKMLNIPHHQGNANQNHYDILHL